MPVRLRISGSLHRHPSTRHRPMNLRTLPTIALVSGAAVGGAYFGLFSCGGYEWHWHAFLGIAALLSGWTVAVPVKKTIGGRLWPLALAPVAFVLTEAAAAPFYPATPDSLDQYGAQFALTLQHGACRLTSAAMRSPGLSRRLARTHTKVLPPSGTETGTGSVASKTTTLHSMRLGSSTFASRRRANLVIDGSAPTHMSLANPYMLDGVMDTNGPPIASNCP
mgnify:CR=1 FL=1